MYVNFEKQQDLIDFLLETYISNNEKTFESWICNKFFITNDKLEVEANTIYYDFGTKYYMRFGDRSVNTNSYLYKIETSDVGNKIKHHYLAQTIVNDYKSERYFLKNIFNDYIKNYKNFSFDIKLRYPNNLKKTFDRNDEYESFCIDFFSDGFKHGIIFTYNEKYKNSNLESPVLWTTYCYNLYLRFLENKENYNKSL